MDSIAQSVKPKAADAKDASRLKENLQGHIHSLEGLADLFGQCAYHLDEGTTSHTIIANLLYLGEQHCRLVQSDLQRALEFKEVK